MSTLRANAIQSLDGTITVPIEKISAFFTGQGTLTEAEKQVIREKLNTYSKDEVSDEALVNAIIFG